MRALKWVIYATIVLAAMAIPVLLALSSDPGPWWFLAVPAGCLLFLVSTKNKPKFSADLVLDDLKRSLKYLAALTGYSILYSLVAAYLARDMGFSAEIDLNFVYGNVIEELLFRATLIPFFEMVERKLFDSVNRVRIIGVGAAVFGVLHVRAIIIAPTPFLRYASMLNIPMAVIGGVLLGSIYYRSRNFPSVVLIHWWINLQTRLLEALAFSMFT